MNKAYFFALDSNGGGRISGKKRPMGITVFAILSIIIGVADFVAVLLIDSLLRAAWLQLGIYSSLIGGIPAFQGIVLFVLARATCDFQRQRHRLFVF
jgi:hypothetical protein